MHWFTKAISNHLPKHSFKKLTAFLLLFFLFISTGVIAVQLFNIQLRNEQKESLSVIDRFLGSMSVLKQCEQYPYLFLEFEKSDRYRCYSQKIVNMVKEGGVKSAVETLVS